MVSLWSWLLPENLSQQPKRWPTDTVLKLGTLERSWMMRGIYMNWSLRFNAVLDEDKLQNSLERLITTGPNWRKLGGRFRLNDQNELELHIPAEFNEQRPPVQFTCESYDFPVDQHALNGTMPSSWEKPCILDGPEELDDILAGPKAPKCLNDWIYTDRPALVVHVIKFTDATFITLTYSHCLVDGVGKREIVVNWCKVLAGCEAAVVPLASIDEDPLPDLVKDSLQENNEPHLYEDKLLTGWRKYYWVLRLLQNLFQYRNRRQRNVFIPASTMARIRQEAQRTHPNDRLSDNQLLTAWLVRLACLPLRGSGRPIGITSAVDLRGFQFEQINPGVVYLQNLLAYTWINTTAPLLLQQPLGAAAMLMRSSLKAQLSLEQVRAAARLTHDAVAATGSPNLFTDKDSFVVSVSSLAKAKYWEVLDFGPAVIRDHEKMDNSGKPVWQCSTPRSGFKSPCLVVVQGKDLLGNWWAQMVMSNTIWNMISKEFEKW